VNLPEMVGWSDHFVGLTASKKIKKLPETNSHFAPENRPLNAPKGNSSNLLRFFRCENVSFREGYWPGALTIIHPEVSIF